MRIIIFPLLLTMLLCISAQAQSDRKLIVKFKPGSNYQVDLAARKFIHPKLAELVLMNQLEDIQTLNINANANTQLKNTELLRDIHFITLPVNTDVNAAISILMSTGLFEYVEKDGIATGAGVNVITPTDPAFTNQWSLKNTGTFSGTAVADADIDMDDAWDITTGNASTIVCVLDAGFKMDHPELSGRIWQNPGEIAGNGIDDDGNGYIDDIRGWDWVNNDNNPTDDHGHGTNVGSIIAAKGNNGSHMAGINWNCQLMVGKVLNSSNSGSYSWITSGIYYAVSKGAKVINISIGGTATSATLQAACDFAMANDVIVVVCMHNQNTSTPYYPAAYSSVIAVGSTSDNDRRTVPFPWDITSGSNYGSHIDLVAPGNNILGAYYLDNTTQTYWSGTSQATPEVAGVVSLMLALKPDLTFTQVRNVLITTSQDMVGDPFEDVPGWDQYYGYGRLNAFAALTEVLSLVPLKFGDIAARHTGNSNYVSWSVFNDDDLQHFELEYSKDRTSWQSVQQLPVQENNASEKHYAISHLADTYSDAYYRVMAVNNDQSYTYSRIVRVKKYDTTPFAIDKIISGRNNLQLVTSANLNTLCTISIYSMDGKLFYKTDKTIVSGTGLLNFNLVLGAGRYQLLVTANGFKISEGFLVR